MNLPKTCVVNVASAQQMVVRHNQEKMVGCIVTSLREREVDAGFYSNIRAQNDLNDSKNMLQNY